MSENQNWEQDVRIDPEALDVEWVKQPETFMRWTKLSADARKHADEKKEELDVLEAKLGLAIRSNPAKYGLEKVTEASVQAIILIDSTRMAMAQELADAKYELDVLTSAVRAMDQKKAALENLVRLQGQSYFAGPSAPRDLKSECDRLVSIERNGAREKVKKAMRKGG